jgi:hypothetical protein
MESEVIYHPGERVTDVIFLVDGHIIRSGYSSGDKRYESGDVIIEDSIYD